MGFVSDSFPVHTIPPGRFYGVMDRMDNSCTPKATGTLFLGVVFIVSCVDPYWFHDPPFCFTHILLYMFHGYRFTTVRSGSLTGFLSHVLIPPSHGQSKRLPNICFETVKKAIFLFRALASILLTVCKTINQCLDNITILRPAIMA